MLQGKKAYDQEDSETALGRSRATQIAACLLATSSKVVIPMREMVARHDLLVCRIGAVQGCTYLLRRHQGVGIFSSRSG